MASDFSRSMQPAELAQWLLRTYGEDYREDVAQLADAKINGELFLDLPNDEELLKGVELSRAFRKLVVRKAKELSGSLDSGPSRARNGQATNTTTSTETVTVTPQLPASLLDTDVLTPDHLQEVLEVTWGARTKYYQFGTALGLKADDLDAIERSNNYKVERAFTDVIKTCLQQELVTKKKLVEAVRSKLVAYSSLGDKIQATNFTAQETVHTPPVQAAVPMTVPTLCDFDSYEVKNHLVSRLEWIDPTRSTGGRRCTKVYQKAASKWNRVAECLGLEPGEINSIRHNNPFSDNDRVGAVFRVWFDNANNLANCKRYPKKWSGLMRLLRDSELGELSEEVNRALSAPYSNVRGTLP